MTNQYVSCLPLFTGRFSSTAYCKWKGEVHVSKPPFLSGNIVFVVVAWPLKGFSCVQVHARVYVRSGIYKQRI